MPPRFATPGTPEFDMASRWCAVYDNERARRDELEQQLTDSQMQLRRDTEQFNRQDFMQEQTLSLRARECRERERM